MNTKKQSIEIAKTVILGYRQELANQFNCVGGDVDFAMRGTIGRILDNLWYDTFSSSLRAKFDYKKENWLIAAGIDNW